MFQENMLMFKENMLIFQENIIIFKENMKGLIFRRIKQNGQTCLRKT